MSGQSQVSASYTSKHPNCGPPRFAFSGSQHLSNSLHSHVSNGQNYPNPTNNISFPLGNSKSIKTQDHKQISKRSHLIPNQSFMATASLLESISLKWNPLFQHRRLSSFHHTHPTEIPRFLRASSKHTFMQWSDASDHKKRKKQGEFLQKERNPSQGILDSSLHHISLTQRPRFLIQCSDAPDHEKKRECELSQKDKNPFHGIFNSITKALKLLQKPAMAAILLGLLLTCDPYSALAASGGRMGGRAFSSSSSRSYSVPSNPGFSYSAPYYAPSPFFGGGGGLYVGVGAGSGFFLLMMGFAAVILVSGFLSDRSEDGSVLTATQKTSVLKLQVGLLGMARSLQRDLDRIAENADTSTSEGLSYVLTETALALLRQPDYCISAYSSVDVKRSIEDGEKRFNQLSIEERGKFDEETLVNVNNIKKQSTSSQRSKGFSNEYIVITILVAAEGVYKLPVINGGADLKEALQKLGSIPMSRTLAVEVLWTPQNENDTLSERELLEDYPLLRPL